MRRIHKISEAAMRDLQRRGVAAGSYSVESTDDSVVFSAPAPTSDEVRSAVLHAVKLYGSDGVELRTGHRTPEAIGAGWWLSLSPAGTWSNPDAYGAFWNKKSKRIKKKKQKISRWKREIAQLREEYKRTRGSRDVDRSKIRNRIDDLRAKVLRAQERIARMKGDDERADTLKDRRKYLRKTTAGSPATRFLRKLF